MHEINLVPDVKVKMIKTLKLRNLIFFICIVVVSVSIGVVAICGSIVGGQSIAMSVKKDRIEQMSSKLGEYSNLNEFLTIQSQLSGIADINSNRKVLSRVFSVIDAMVPHSNDRVEISELTIDLETTTITMDAQANAGEAPLIDYRVLESFKKGVALTKYDYGRYVDEGGENIPTICIVETDSDGNAYEENGAIYALWYKNQKGCNPTAEAEAEAAADEGDEDSEGSENTNSADAEADQNEQIKIWRTPQFDEWYKEGYLSTDGSISGVPHFDSQCIQYSGTESGEDTAKWSATNDCLLTEEGLVVDDSSNGKDADDELVLRFSASVEIAPEVFSFNNKHMMIIGPSGQDVTDSYRQIEGMFAKRAEDCAEGDLECATNTINVTGEE